MKSSQETVQRVIENSRRKYARPRAVVEKEIIDWSGVNKVSENEVDCMNCGKHVTLPFAPTPGRPVYCPECYAKVKAGELAPARVPAPRPTEEKRERVARPEAPRRPWPSEGRGSEHSSGPAHPEKRQSVVRPSVERKEVPIEKVASVSLDDLKHTPATPEKLRTEHKAHETENSEELRKALSEAL
ncbi:MAG: CxxC-x17-CxxC domain-containing protein, partial [Patescibacteria group bacterium]